MAYHSLGSETRATRLCFCVSHSGGYLRAEALTENATDCIMGITGSVPLNVLCSTHNKDISTSAASFCKM